jgi:hypothetical protein
LRIEPPAGRKVKTPASGLVDVVVSVGRSVSGINFGTNPSQIPAPIPAPIPAFPGAGDRADHDGGRGLDTLAGGLASFSSGSDGTDFLDGGRDEDTAKYAYRLDDLRIPLRYLDRR